MGEGGLGKSRNEEYKDLQSNWATKKWRCPSSRRLSTKRINMRQGVGEGG